MKFTLKTNSGSAQGPGAFVSMRCPACRQMGTFESRVVNVNDMQLVGTVNGQPQTTVLEQRSCPNPDCRTHVFFAYDPLRQSVLISYPPERIDFETAEIPKPIVAAFEEAITCHAHQFFVAAAIMVRKTLELLCSDRNATGKNLKDRIKALSTTVVLPVDLLDGLDDLRLLGNDAAHIESTEYAKVDQEEVEVAIELTKEVLKGVYQYSALLSRLKRLKKQPSA
jgi:hypothetical protein